MFSLRNYSVYLLSFFLYLTINAQNQPPVIEAFFASATMGMDPSLPDIFLNISDADNSTVSVKLYRILENESDWTLFYEEDNFPVGETQSINYFESINEFYIQGPFKVEVFDNEAVNIQQLVNEVNTDSLLYFMESIIGVRHRTADPEHLADVKDFIENRFNQHNYSSSRQGFQFGSNYTGENIIGDKNTCSDSGQFYIVDGHFDTVADSPGADDNGSAVAGMLEVARVLEDAVLDKNVRFIGFDLEETGLDGSIEYITNGISETDTIEGVFNFEMIGYYDEMPNAQMMPAGFELLFPEAAAALEANEFKGDFINNVANENSATLMNLYEENANLYVPDLKVISFAAPGNAEIAQDLRRSDHAVFWDAGIPALMLTDGANFRNPFYHSPYDTLGTLDFDFMANVVKATVASIADLANLQSADLAYTDITIISSDSELLPVSSLFHANNIIQLELDRSDFLWQIADINGKVIKQGKEAGNTLQLSSGDLITGMYFFTVFQDNKSKTLKFVLE